MRKFFSIALAAVALCSLVSCSSKSEEPLVIWTSSKEFATYVEQFNATHTNAKAVLVYKEQPARALPPAKDEQTPDLIIGSWLKNSTTRKYFTPLDYLFQERLLNKSVFYRQLIDYGVINEKQYLVPISFNIPAIAYDSRQEANLPEGKSLTLNQIKECAKAFNTTDKSGNYTAMGFAPVWDTDFLYLVSKMQGASYREKGNSFSWNETAMEQSIRYLRAWTQDCNTDSTAEQNFQFKYLTMPEYKQVISGRTLFAYMTSDELFTLSPAQLEPLSFRWIQSNGMSSVEDSLVTVGLYKHAKHSSQAELFLKWFFTTQTQVQLIQKQEEMKLDTRVFGIASGFSSIAQVNEACYPTYYSQLLGKLPEASSLTLPNILPYRWTSLKQQVIIPYLQQSSDTTSQKEVDDLTRRIADWSKQFF